MTKKYDLVVLLLWHCALSSCGAVYCNRSCLWVCDSGRAMSEPYYSQRAQCLRLSERFFQFVKFCNEPCV